MLDKMNSMLHQPGQGMQPQQLINHQSPFSEGGQRQKRPNIKTLKNHINRQNGNRRQQNMNQFKPSQQRNMQDYDDHDHNEQTVPLRGSFNPNQNQFQSPNHHPSPKFSQQGQLKKFANRQRKPNHFLRNAREKEMHEYANSTSVSNEGVDLLKRKSEQDNDENNLTGAIPHRRFNSKNRVFKFHNDTGEHAEDKSAATRIMKRKTSTSFTTTTSFDFQDYEVVSNKTSITDEGKSLKHETVMSTTSQPTTSTKAHSTVRKHFETKIDELLKKNKSIEHLLDDPKFLDELLEKYDFLKEH